MIEELKKEIRTPEADEEKIRSAVKHFESLLREQLKRRDDMASARPPRNFLDGRPVTIGVIDGDGIGPIIMREAERVLRFLLRDEMNAGTVILRRIEGLTLENRTAKGQAVPDDVLAAVKACDVLLKGPTTTPKGGTLESANVVLRRSLDLFANVRPVVVPEEGVDWIFFRENTEGEYALGSRGIAFDDILTADFKVTTDTGTRRIARAAFEYARQNGKKNVAIVTKANILKKTDGMFSRIAHEVASQYPEIEAEDWYVDIMAANLVNPAVRSKFQVFLLPNLYGDILTDEAAQIQGGVGTAGSSNTGDHYAMFEAIHGSAPRKIAAGEGAYANPASILRATEMLLRHIGRIAEADHLNRAMNVCLEEERRVVVTGHADGATCEAFGDYLLEKLAVE
ncbi:MAG: isocitrate/isopropylmalate dehydrogenase family protein [Oscillospiraceae bacterium]|nr:isocitrate/isopropylmalate dehydrogenase family protein [Oscillospiraceae bacterium]